jgi:predicted HAD superfamily Cof-like phosphohydrolase
MIDNPGEINGFLPGDKLYVISCSNIYTCMKKIDSLNQVAEFHQTFQHPIENHPIIPSRERCDLRVSLIREELNELEEAIEKKSIVEVADALCDIQYVLSGAVLEFGLGEKFSDLFDEVHRSNMSKACKTEEEARATVAYYQEKEHTESYYRKLNGMYMVYRATDHKTLKSINYSPANLNSIIENNQE